MIGDALFWERMDQNGPRKLFKLDTVEFTVDSETNCPFWYDRCSKFSSMKTQLQPIFLKS